MATEVFVHVDVAGATELVGRLWLRNRKGRESATFEYAPTWLAHSQRFALEPALALATGPFHTRGDERLFGALGDSAPDRWGRMLLRRAERRHAHSEGRTPRTLLEADYLLAVDDQARQGALRFSTAPDGPFLAEPGERRIPPLVELPRLLAATRRVIESAETDEDIRLLLAPGSSLGGARPKASVLDRDGSLAIAKFPRRDDETATVLWEAVALRLAEKASISVPSWRLERPAETPVLVLRRFDREGGRRIPFLSALSMLGARGGEARSYLDIADALRRYGAAMHEDQVQLWRRIVFSILISNTDDHLRNHAFLYIGQDGWRLSPAYDMNPVPLDVRPHVLSTAIDLDDTTASLDLAFEVADYFGLSSSQARSVANEVAKHRGRAPGCPGPPALGSCLDSTMQALVQMRMGVPRPR